MKEEKPAGTVHPLAQGLDHPLACIIIQRCMLMAGAKVTFVSPFRLEMFIKQLIHDFSCDSSCYDSLGKFGEQSRSWRCFQTSHAHHSTMMQAKIISYMFKAKLLQTMHLALFIKIR